KPLIVGALALDALLFFGMTLDLPFPAFMALRFFEGGAHIFALSLLLALGADSAAPERRGRVMGVLGGGLTFGVAMGAPIGQALGRLGPLVVLEVGAVLLALTAGLAALALRDAPTRE